MICVTDPKLLGDFEQAEIDDPTPRKEVGGRIIYVSRQLKNVPTAIGLPVLDDFGSAEWGEEENKRDAHPNPFRSPEVILKLPWSYEIDIWNLGCLVG
jgi:serine/threonine-protein kinase SRPK3